MVADALSRRDTNTGADAAALHALSSPSLQLLDEVHAVTATDEEMGRLLLQLQDASIGALWCTDDDFLLHGKRIFMPAQHDLHQRVLALAHTTAREGIQKTLQRLHAGFYIPSDRALIQDYIRAYFTC
jgi:hypothetical protein